MRAITIAIACLARVEHAIRLAPLDASRESEIGKPMTTLAELLLANRIGLEPLGRGQHVALSRNIPTSTAKRDLLSAVTMQSGKKKGAGLWFRCDLRLDDQLALQAAADSKTMLPIFVFDPAKFRTPTLAGSIKSSARRARFLLESVACLRKQLESRGSGLVVAVGSAPDVIQRFCESCEEVYVTEGICSEECTEEAEVEELLKRSNTDLERIWGNTLYMPKECGNDPEGIPLLFTNFKNKAESKGRVRNPVDAPVRLPPLPEFADAKLGKEVEDALRFLPSLEDLGYSAKEATLAMQDDPRAVLPFAGGEEAARDRLQKWMFDDDKLKEYFDIRNGMLGEGYSSKFSPWLALGCLSPRRVWKEAQRYEKERRIKNKSTYGLVFELIWRDFFAYMGLSYGDRLFTPGGITGKPSSWRGGDKALTLWKEGRTGDKLVDANMRELSATGFMSNRGRQNVASYLIFNLGVDWRYGAAHFEELLLDYDPCSNWGNWVAAAGLTGQRINKFNTKSQLSRYDPQGEYVNHWIPGSYVATQPGSRKSKYEQGQKKKEKIRRSNERFVRDDSEDIVFSE